MSCLNFICQNQDQEKEVQQSETKNMYIKSQKQMGVYNANQINSKFRDERKSLRRILTPQNNNYSQMGQHNFAVTNIGKTNEPINMYLSHQVQQTLNTNIIDPILRYSQPNMPNHDWVTTQVQPQPVWIPPQTQIRKITQLRPQTYSNEKNINSISNNFNNKNISFNYQQQMPIFSSTQNISNARKQENKSYPNLVLQPQKNGKQNKSNFYNISLEQKKVIEEKIRKQDKVAINKEVEVEQFLKPVSELDLMTYRNSRCIGNVNHIDDIACTKTESVGSSSESSSQFSEILYQINDGLRQKKMTNSSINFLTGNQQTKTDNWQNKKSSQKIKKSEPIILDKKQFSQR